MLFNFSNFLGKKGIKVILKKSLNFFLPILYILIYRFAHNKFSW